MHNATEDKKKKGGIVADPVEAHIKSKSRPINWRKTWTGFTGSRWMLWWSKFSSNVTHPNAFKLNCLFYQFSFAFSLKDQPMTILLLLLFLKSWVISTNPFVVSLNPPIALLSPSPHAASGTFLSSPIIVWALRFRVNIYMLKIDCSFTNDLFKCCYDGSSVFLSRDDCLLPSHEWLFVKRSRFGLFES